jgi:hypothetical protein
MCLVNIFLSASNSPISSLPPQLLREHIGEEQSFTTALASGCYTPSLGELLERTLLDLHQTLTAAHHLPMMTKTQPKRIHREKPNASD